MSEKFIRGNISAALDLVINCSMHFGTKFVLTGQYNGKAATAKVVIQSHTKEDIFIVDLYGDLTPCKGSPQKDGTTTMAVRYCLSLNRDQLIDIIIDNELVLTTE